MDKEFINIMQNGFRFIILGFNLKWICIKNLKVTITGINLE